MTATDDIYHDETEEQAAQREASDSEEKRADALLRAVMDTREGRTVLWSLLTELGLFQSDATIEPMRLAQSVARRNYALELHARLDRACPDQLTRAKREANG